MQSERGVSAVILQPHSQVLPNVKSNQEVQNRLSSPCILVYPLHCVHQNIDRMGTETHSLLYSDKETIKSDNTIKLGQKHLSLLHSVLE